MALELVSLERKERKESDPRKWNPRPLAAGMTAQVQDESGNVSEVTLSEIVGRGYTVIVGVTNDVSCIPSLLYKGPNKSQWDVVPSELFALILESSDTLAVQYNAVAVCEELKVRRAARDAKSQGATQGTTSRAADAAVQALAARMDAAEAERKKEAAFNKFEGLITGSNGAAWNESVKAKAKAAGLPDDDIELLSDVAASLIQSTGNTGKGGKR